MTGAALHRGTSSGVHGTPRAFLDAVEARFGAISFDLAASPENAVCSEYYTETDDSLLRDWTLHRGNLWLNPPFADIAPWAKKCAQTPRVDGTRILLLTPASVGSNWFAEYVYPYALVLALRPRMSFDGRNPYPKDLILSVFGDEPPGFDLWRWRA